jgi:hypothetical protein
MNTPFKKANEHPLMDIRHLGSQAQVFFYVLSIGRAGSIERK